MISRCRREPSTHNSLPMATGCLSLRLVTDQYERSEIAGATVFGPTLTFTVLSLAAAPFAGPHNVKLLGLVFIQQGANLIAQLGTGLKPLGPVFAALRPHVRAVGGKQRFQLGLLIGGQFQAL